MKKNNIFKAIGIVMLFYILCTWIVPIIYSIAGSDAQVDYQIGVFSIFSIILETFSGFGSIVLFVLLVGAFYGVFKATGAYEKVLTFLTSKAQGREKIVLIAIMILMAVISSISGLDLGLLILFPLLMALVVKMGYDKLVALSATVGATIVGMYGATFAGTLYGVNKSMLNLDNFDQILVKVLFLVLGVVALVVFTSMYANKKAVKLDAKKDKKHKVIKESVKKDSKKKEDKKTDNKPVKEEKVKKEKVKREKNKLSIKLPVKREKVEKEKKERTALPALVIFGFLVLVIFLGTTSWEAIFGSNWFTTAHTAWTGVKIGDFEILNKLFGGVEPLGTWTSPMRFQTYSMLLVIAMIALAIVYRKSPKETFAGFVDGIKSFVVPVIGVVLACSVFVFVYYNPLISTVTSLLLQATEEFNVALSTIYTAINSLFYVDYYYLSYSVLYPITSVYSDASILSIISVMFTSIYSLVMLIAPTSVLLVVSLLISDVKYTTWVKYIWKLVLTLLIISLIVFSIMLLV